MTRRSFLTQFLQGTIVACAAPQIVTHGLKLWTPRRVITNDEFDLWFDVKTGITWKKLKSIKDPKLGDWMMRGVEDKWKGRTIEGRGHFP